MKGLAKSNRHAAYSAAFNIRRAHLIVSSLVANYNDPKLTTVSRRGVCARIEKRDNTYAHTACSRRKWQCLWTRKKRKGPRGGEKEK